MSTLDHQVFDAIVVGSGAAGSWAAKDLTERGMSVLLLEAGRDLEPDDFPADVASDRQVVSLYRVRAALRGQHIQCRCSAFGPSTMKFFVNDRHNPYATPRGRPYHWYRGRQVGGRLHTWARCAVRMSDTEFKAATRDGYGEDWPLSYADLAPYYDRVEKFLGVHGSRDGVAHVPDGSFIPPLPNSPMETRIRQLLHERCPEREPFSTRIVRHNPARVPLPLRAAQSTGRLRVRADAVVSHILMDPSTNKARGVAYVDRNSGRASEARGNVVVLCASAIESVRIMLNSACSNHSAGLGNSSGTLGRYIMDHVMVLKVGDAGPSLLDRSPVNIEGPEDPYDFGARGLYFPSFRNVRERHSKFIRGYGMVGAFGREANRWFLAAFGEMLPRFENRITLHPTRTDAWGVPIARIDCMHSSNERAMIADMHETTGELADITDLKIRKLEEVRPVRRTLYKLLRPFVFSKDGAFFPGASIHETGGARMGRSPVDSVLNDFNQCWDVKNLFVTDGACFVSSGFQNVTLTIMALTARACDYIAEEYRKGEL